MDGRTLDVWRLTWPKAIPAHDYETALQLAALVSIAGRKPEASTPAVAGPPAAEDLISVAEAATILGISEQTVYAWARRGAITRRQAANIRGFAFSRAEVEAARRPGPRLVHSAAPEGEPPAGTISVKQASSEYRIPVRYIYKAVRDRKIKPAGTVGSGKAKRMLVARADVEALKASRAGGE
jgi:excisionase family DNA binding protein